MKARAVNAALVHASGSPTALAAGVVCVPSYTPVGAIESEMGGSSRAQMLRMALLAVTIAQVAGRAQAPLPPPPLQQRSKAGGNGMVIAAIGCGALTAGVCAWGGVRQAVRRDKRQSQSEAVADVEPEAEAEVEAEAAEAAEAAVPAPAEAPASKAPASKAPASKVAPPAPKFNSVPETSGESGDAGAKAAAAEGGFEFSLTPERLSAIAALNPRLEPVADLLGGVPVFTVTVGGSASPLTVPGPGGQKIAYFFFEAADAAAFLRAVMEQARPSVSPAVVSNP